MISPPSAKGATSWRSVVVWVVLVLVVVVVPASVASAATASQAEVVAPGTSTPLRTGDSSTDFSLLLPGGAHCPGDSTKPPYWQTSTYLVPKGTDPGSIDFKAFLPSPGYGLRAYGGPWEAVDVEKGTGLVLLPPSFDFPQFGAAVVLPHQAHTSTWETGIACANLTGKASVFWNVEITISAAPSHPGGWVWTVREPTHLPSPGRPLWPVLAGLAAIAAAGLVMVTGRRSPPKPPATRPDPEPIAVGTLRGRI